MQIIRDIATLRQTIREFRNLHYTSQKEMNDVLTLDHHVGFIPTMGYLHEGHLSLMRRAKNECQFVVLSIFVNPLQFAPNEDYHQYPRDEKRDCELAELAGADVVFLPDREMMYPKLMLTSVKINKITEGFEGTSRPGHFEGVATVVMKLFHIVKPDKAYFGLKDAQQVAVIEQMVTDMNMEIEVISCSTFREADGLAMSSRNIYLSTEHRKQAVVISQALKLTEQYYEKSKELDSAVLTRITREHILTAPDAQIDYVNVAAYPSFQPITATDSKAILAVAVRFGQTRLIDNTILTLRR
jgi:pantoate--beta-alanine ligase